MKHVRMKYSKNVIMSYLNINSIRNKVEALKVLVTENVDILCVAETKLDSTFPNAQFALKNFSKPYRLDVNSCSGGLLTYIKTNIPSKLLSKYIFPTEIQCIPIELILRKQKWLIISIYRPPSQKLKFFLDSISEGIDFYSTDFERVCILGDFNTSPSDADLIAFMNDHCLTNMIKNPTCFKSKNGTTIDLILTNYLKSFQKTQSVETGTSNHHHLIFKIFKTNFVHLPPK